MCDREDETSQGDRSMVFLVVRPARGADEDTVKAYLYAHSHVLTIENQGWGPVLLVVVADLERAGYLADYQADRLRSGNHRVQRCETYTKAWNYAAAELAHA